MRKHTPNIDFRVNSLVQGIPLFACLFLLINLFSCMQELEDSRDLALQKTSSLTPISIELPATIQGKIIDSNTVQPPIISFLKGKPKVIPAIQISIWQNARSINMPKKIEIMTIGKAADLLKVIANKLPEDVSTENYLTK